MGDNSRPARLFVAVDLSGEVKALVSAEQERVRARAGRALRFVSSEQLHLTLAFMAAVEQARVPPLVAAISRGFDDPPFTIAFSGFGVFPPHGRPRVLFLDVVEGAAKLAAVQRLVAERLAEQGIALEDRPYRPHLTLARWREGHSADARRILASARGERLQQDVAHVTLYHSRLSSNGATHTALAKGELAGAQ